MRPPASAPLPTSQETTRRAIRLAARDPVSIHAHRHGLRTRLLEYRGVPASTKAPLPLSTPRASSAGEDWVGQTGRRNRCLGLLLRPEGNTDDLVPRIPPPFKGKHRRQGFRPNSYVPTPNLRGTRFITTCRSANGQHRPNRGSARTNDRVSMPGRSTEGALVATEAGESRREPSTIRDKVLPRHGSETEISPSPPPALPAPT